MNRLIHEKSPYLLQHAHNPVDWYPWCDVAFNKARNGQADIPFHRLFQHAWCHVMERESLRTTRGKAPE
jgi:uncharacterized protein YyaL (SSP411 family)